MTKKQVDIWKGIDENPGVNNRVFATVNGELVIAYYCQDLWMYENKGKTDIIVKTVDVFKWLDIDEFIKLIDEQQIEIDEARFIFSLAYKYIKGERLDTIKPGIYKASQLFDK